MICQDVMSKKVACGMDIYSSIGQSKTGLRTGFKHIWKKNQKTICLSIVVKLLAKVNDSMVPKIF
jgi:hypothetical protein